MVEINTINNLRQYLSQDENREIVILNYILDECSPTDVAKRTGISISTVDRFTRDLKFQRIIIFIDKKDRKSIYHINWDFWIYEALSTFGFSNINDEDIAKVKDIIDYKPLILFFKIVGEKDVLSELFMNLIEKSDLADDQKNKMSIINSFAQKLGKQTIILYPLTMISTLGIPLGMNISDDARSELDKLFLGLANKYLEKNKYLKEFVGEFTIDMLNKISSKIKEFEETFVKLMEKEVENQKL